MLPQSLSRHSPVWFIATALEVGAAIFSLLATVLPIKTVLILAEGNIPSFFPAFLIELGLITTTVFLLALAACFAGFAGVTLKVVKKLDGVWTIEDRGHFDQDEPLRQRMIERRKSRSVEKSLTLAIVLVVIIGATSVPYLLLSLGWVLASWIATQLVTKSMKEKPFADSPEAVFAKWLRNTALWSMVGIAVVTLLTFPPVLGTTGILIAFIFGRRFLFEVAEAGIDLAEIRNRRDSAGGPILADLTEPRPADVRFPIQYLSSETGAAALAEYLVRDGFSLDSCRVVGGPADRVVSLIAGVGGNKQRLIRVFSFGQEALRDSEVLDRRENKSHGFAHPHESRTSSVGVFPSLEVDLQGPSELLNENAKVTLEQVATYQVLCEVRSLGEMDSPTIQASPSFNADVFQVLLDRARRIPGSHSSACRRLAGRVNEIFGLVAILPVVWVPVKPLSPSSFYTSQDGSLRFLGGSAWKFGHPGDSWRGLNRYGKAFREISSAGLVEGVTGDLIMLNAGAHELYRQLLGFQLSQINSTVKVVETSLRRIEAPIRS